MIDISSISNWKNKPRMAPLRWPETRHELALAKEVAQHNPEKPDEWEAVARRLGKAFSLDSYIAELRQEAAVKKWITFPRIHFFNLNRIMFERRTANG